MGSKRKPDTVRVSVLVPYRESSQDRAEAWTFLRGQWARRHPTWEVTPGDSDREEWSKGAAVGAALRAATGDIIVMADADVWCDGAAEAVAAVIAGASWAIPHRRVLRLTDHASREVYETGTWPTVRTSLTYAQRPYPGQPGGGIAVMRREIYEAAPIDARFEGWGQEDESWNLCLQRLAGRPWRGTADLWHLWHEAAPRQSRAVGSTAGRRLYKRYAMARDRVKMTALVDEARLVEATA
jgi:hypothetical protein